MLSQEQSKLDLENCPICQNCSETKCPESDEDTALLAIGAPEWFVNADDESEIFFELQVINYGFVEAKNVIIKCALWDEGTKPNSSSENLVITVQENVGNVASTSVNIKDIPIRFRPIINHYYSSQCVPISCDGNCEFIQDRIPENNKEVEKLRNLKEE